MANSELMGDYPLVNVYSLLLKIAKSKGRGFTH